MDLAKPIIVDGKTFRPVTDETLTSLDLEVARIELNETPQSRALALQKLREKLKRKEGLTARTDEPYLLRFLRARKFDCELALKLILRYYSMRSKHSEIYSTPTKLQRALKARLVFRCNYRDDQGRVLFVIRAGAWDPDELSMEEFAAAVTLVLEHSLDDPVAQINGFVGIWDTSGFTFKQFMVVCRSNGIGLMNSLLQDCYPGRIKMIYCINCSALIRNFWRITNPLMKEKIRKRIHILGSNLDELHKFVNPAMLPEELGGRLPPFDNERAIQQMLDKEERFRYDQKFGYQTSES